MVAHRESAELAKRLIAETCEKQEIVPGTLTIHANRGSSMTSQPVALWLADLGIAKSHSRPHVSNDNPYSESQFRTMKYRPEFPGASGARKTPTSSAPDFFCLVNTAHRHSGIEYHTPESVHHGLAVGIREQRAAVLEPAYAAHSERFLRAKPQPPALPTAVWINAPTKEVTQVQKLPT